MEQRTVPYGLQIAEAIGQAVGTLAVILALLAFAWQVYQYRQDRTARDAQAIEDRNRHEAQIAALRQAEDDRLAAQARRITPSIFRGTVFSKTLWNVRIDNSSSDAISAIHIDILIKDGSGNIVPHGYRLASKSTVGEKMLEVILPEFSRTLDGMSERYTNFIDEIKAKALTLAQNQQELDALTEQFNSQAPALEMNQETASALQAQVNHAVNTQFTDEWPEILAPWRFTAMAIETTRADYVPHVKMRFQDSSCYVWERTDTDAPTRISEPRAVSNSEG